MAHGGMSRGSDAHPPGGRPSREDRALAARRRLTAQIAASKRARTQRTLALLTGALSAVVLLTAGSGWLLSGYVSSHLGREAGQVFPGYKPSEVLGLIKS